MTKNILQISCLLVTILLLMNTSVIAQQPAQYSMYMLNQYNYNVAYAGMDNYLSATGVFRKQWLGLTGSPTTQNVNVHMPWQYLKGGAGLSIQNDILGAERNTAFSVSYNYIARLNEGTYLSLGLGGGLIQKAIDGEKLRAPEGVYEGNTINHNDDFIPLGLESAIAPTATFGVYVKTKSLQLGLSANDLIESDLSFGSNLVTNVQLKRNYHVYAAYDIEISDGLSLQPSALLKSDLVQTQVDFSILSEINDNIFGGVSFRGYSNETIDALIFMAGMNVTRNLKLAYAYDLSISGLSSYNSGSHEIMLNYNLGKELGGMIPAKVIYNPRFY